MAKWAKSMLWKGIHPIVEASTVIYEKGISLKKAAMMAIEKRLIRNPDLPKWDILIKPLAILQGMFFAANHLRTSPSMV
jgi:hypothetical protein